MTGCPGQPRGPTPRSWRWPGDGSFPSGRNAHFWLRRTAARRPARWGHSCAASASIPRCSRAGAGRSRRPIGWRWPRRSAVKRPARQRAIAPNFLQRRFSVDIAAPAWTSDITYVATREGWLYLAVIIAVQTRQVLGYSLSDRMPDELVLNALRNACHLDAPPPGTLFHSDRGSQYASDDFREALSALGMVASMRRKGNCWDNAVSGSFFATLKTEEATEPYATKQEAHRAIAQYIHGFCNPVRLHSSLGYLSPNEYARRMQHVDQHPSMRSAAQGPLHWARYAGRDHTHRQMIKRRAEPWARRYAAMPPAERLTARPRRSAPGACRADPHRTHADCRNLHGGRSRFDRFYTLPLWHIRCRQGVGRSSHCLRHTAVRSTLKSSTCDNKTFT